jgi:hypothetical protein
LSARFLQHDTATITKEIRELEDLVETEKAKKMEANAGRIGADLKEIKKENAAVIAQIKESMA